MSAQWKTERPIVRTLQGLHVAVGDLVTMHKVRSEITDGRMVVIEHTLSARRLAAPLHRHSREDEISYVLAGEMTAILGEHVIQAGAGSYVIQPRGQWHTYWNSGAEDLRLMEIIVPGGFEGCLDRLAEALADSSQPSVVARIGAEYGVEFDFASVAALCRQFRVTLPGWPSRHARVESDTRAIPIARR